MAQRVGRGIALLFLDRGTRRGWVVSSTPQPHFTPGKDSVPILQETGWAPGPVWVGRKSRPYQHSIPDRLAHSQSLYQLSYPLKVCIVYRKTRASAVISKEASQEVSADRKRRVYMCCGQNAGQRKPLKTDYNSFEKTAKFVFLWATVTNHNYILEQTKSKVNSGNALHVSVQNILCSICCPKCKD